MEVESGVLLSGLGWLQEKKYPAVAARLATPGQPIALNSERCCRGKDVRALKTLAGFQALVVRAGEV